MVRAACVRVTHESSVVEVFVSGFQLRSIGMSRRLFFTWVLAMAVAPIAAGCGSDESGKKKKDDKKK